MASYNPMNNQGQFQYNTNSAVENRGLFSRILRNLSTWGMNYDDMIMRNQVGVGINEDPYAQQGNSMYDFFSRRAVASILNRKSIPYLDRSYADKRRILREYSIKDEIRDFISTVCDECIIYSEKDFCSPRQLPTEFTQDIKDKYQEYFEKIYNRYGFADSVSAWQLMKDFIIDGYVAMEIIWDDKKKNIIGFNRLRPETLVPAFEPSIGHLWIQYPEDPQLRRIFLDSQIIFISYSSQNDYSETSYVEGLIKPYNQLKIIEQTKIMFNLVNATLYQKFVIPIKGLGRQRAEEQIGQLIQDYSEEVEWDDSLGTLRINGQKHLSYNKQYWFPEGDGGVPNMEIMNAGTGHNLNEDDILKWFFNILKRASKIPMQRFQDENGGGNVFADAAEITRDESKFGNFVMRLRSNFKELMVKPLKLQMLVEFPELKDDERFMNEVDIQFLSNQLFEEWKKLGNLSKKADILGTLTGIQKSDGTPYFHIEYLIDHVLKLTPEEKEENKKYWLKDAAGAGAGPEGAGAEGGETGGESAGEMGGAQAAPEGGAQTTPEAPAGGEAGGGEAGGGEAGGGEAGGGEFEF
jgi:hypothetical protein